MITIELLTSTDLPREIRKNLQKNDWIISIFDLDDQDIYDPSKFFDENKDYRLLIDTNIFSYIIQAQKRLSTSPRCNRVGLLLSGFQYYY
jgi:hypothetical protein